MQSLNQLFVFKNFKMVPWILAESNYRIVKINKTCLEYASENFGKNVVFNLPFSLIDLGSYIEDVYPYSPVLGLVDEIERFRPGFAEKLNVYNYIIFAVRSIDEVLGNRRILKSLKQVNCKKIIVLGFSGEYDYDEIRLFNDLADIYDFKPVILVDNKKKIDKIEAILGLTGYSKCTSRWFNYNAVFYIENTPTIHPVQTILYPYRSDSVEFISFNDCMALLCRRGEEPTPQSIIKFIIDNIEPVLRLRDIVIDSEFLSIIDALNEYGSIRMASKKTGLSYARIRRVIKDLEKLEDLLGVKLVESRRGGIEHGRTCYTHIGEIVINNLSELYGELIRRYSNLLGSIKSRLDNTNTSNLCVFPLML